LKNKLTLCRNWYDYNNKLRPTHAPSCLVPYLHDRIIKPIITKSKYLSYHQPYPFTSLLCSKLSTSTLSTNTFNYITDNNSDNKSKNVDVSNTISIDSNKDIQLNDIASCAHFPLLVKQPNLIKIPNKVHAVLKKYTPRKMLRDINKDEETAIEMCLLFLSYLSYTYFNYNNPDVDDKHKRDGWKSLSSIILQDTFGRGIYKRIIEALMHPTSKGSILECDALKIVGSKSYSYRLGAAYIGKGIFDYQLQNNYVKSLLLKSFYSKMARAESNIISKNLLKTYRLITLPTIDEITNEANRLIQLDFHTKKGKRLCLLNKHTKDYYKDPKKLSFVEDNVKLFQFLTSNGFMIPDVGKEKNGGRVVDSFTLMPSWIRALVKINGKPLAEIDYKALHPNIAMKLYGGNRKYITHDAIAEASGVDRLLVKKEHLSFFNKHPEQMKKSPLYDYYMANEEQLMRTLINEKYSSKDCYDITSSKDRYKITSRRMFEVEVNVMTEVIERLNAEEIYVLYIYDALACHPSQAVRVKQVMDEVILAENIFTKASINGLNEISISNNEDINPEYLKIA
jgi:hypothetical protein